jgi:hypothetical protein
METFQLYKKRDFSALVNDTLQFFKLFWKNYFRNYIMINGALLLIMVALYYFLFKDIFSNAFNPEAMRAGMMYGGNPMMYVGLMLVFMVVAIALGVTSMAFPMVYLNLLRTTGRDTFTASEILDGIKQDAGRMILFFLATLFTLVPIAIIVLAIGVALSIIVIGIPLLVLSLPTVMIWGTQALYVYLEEGCGFFEALGQGWRVTFTKYWHVVGSTIIIYICVSIASGVFTMFPSFMMMSSIITSGGKLTPMTMNTTTIVLYVIGMLVSFIACNLLYVQQGLVYYSSQENAENFQALFDIDTIGQNEE